MQYALCFFKQGALVGNQECNRFYSGPTPFSDFKNLNLHLIIFSSPSFLLLFGETDIVLSQAHQAGILYN